MRRVTQVFAQAVSQAGIGHLEGAFPDTAAAWRETMEAGKHHMGTTRMHVAPQHGVVDQNSRVHGTSNLFVTGSSVFPSGGYANPTLTIVALAARLADHLKRSPGTPS
jgi:choline dehydrogenase-like flavoprotein